MPNLGTYLGWHSAGDLEEWMNQANREDTAVGFIVNRSPTSITIVRNGAALPAVTVWLGQDTGQPSEPAADSGVGAKQMLLLIAASDADIQRGDEFKYPATASGLNCEVVYVEHTFNGMIQAKVETMQ